MRTTFLIVLLGFLPCAVAENENRPANLQRYEATHQQMGTQFRLVYYTDQRDQADAIAAEAFARIDALNAVMSDYLPESELSRLSAISGSDTHAPLSEDLWKVLHLSVKFSKQSSGAFDVTVGPLMHLWRSSRRQGRLPNRERLAITQQSVGYQHLELDRENQSVRLKVPGMKLDLGGIAKGYAVDEALAVIAARGVKAALVDGGGDIRVSEAPPGEAGWKIQLNHFADDSEKDGVISVANCAVATSGDQFRHIEIEGQRYSHIIDPRTGLGLTTLRSVTVIAATATTADALASTLSILEPEASRDLLERHHPAASARIITKKDEDTSVVALGAFPKPID